LGRSSIIPPGRPRPPLATGCFAFARARAKFIMAMIRFNFREQASMMFFGLFCGLALCWLPLLAPFGF